MSNFESKEPCVVCNFYAERSTCYHHLLTRKVYPEYANANWNKLSCCISCHNDFHSKGTRIMAEKHKSVKDWLIMQGWTYDCFFEEWNKPDNV